MVDWEWKYSELLKNVEKLEQENVKLKAEIERLEANNFVLQSRVMMYNTTYGIIHKD